MNLITATNGVPIKCASVRGLGLSSDPLTLKVGYTDDELKSFLFTEERMYRPQGTVWLADGSWLERDGDDCGQWWERRSAPAIPPELTTLE